MAPNRSLVPGPNGENLFHVHSDGTFGLRQEIGEAQTKKIIGKDGGVEFRLGGQNRSVGDHNDRHADGKFHTGVDFDIIHHPSSTEVPPGSAGPKAEIR